MLKSPPKGESVELLSRYVVDLTTAVNALLRLTVSGAFKGKLVMSGDTAVIVIEQKTDPSSINSA
jgi:hypothetical protein